ncbi:MAG: hypothetical protein AAB839_00210 [Patescibacteria group bacterium]
MSNPPVRTYGLDVRRPRRFSLLDLVMTLAVLGTLGLVIWSVANGSAYNLFQSFNRFDVTGDVDDVPVQQIRSGAEGTSRFGVILVAYGSRMTLTCDGADCGTLRPDGAVTLSCAKEWRGWVPPPAVACVVAGFPHN